jgi:DNA replication protein DnaC
VTRASSELAHLFCALKAPAAARALPRLADRAREESWSYERFAEALLSTEVSPRDSHGGEGRIKAARYPARKTLEEFDFTFQHIGICPPYRRLVESLRRTVDALRSLRSETEVAVADAVIERLRNEA